MFATAVRIEHDLGVPSASFNALTGHRSCAPEDCSGFTEAPPQGPAPVTSAFPVGVWLHLLEAGLQEIRPSPYPADPSARHSMRLDMAAGFLACYFPLKARKTLAGQG